MKIGILGATGQAGKIIAAKLLSQKAGIPVLFGRYPEKLETLSDSLRHLASEKLETAVVDIRDPNALEKAFRKLDFMVIALSSPENLPAIISAALATGTHCIDILLGSKEKREVLESYHELFKKSGICYITDCGYHPGIPGAMARWADELCPGLHDVDIFGSFGLNWKAKCFATETIADFTRELKTMDMSILENSQWKTCLKNRRFDFNDGRGIRNCIAMGMDEIRIIRQYIPTLNHAGFFIAGFGKVVDWVVLPSCFAALALFPNAKQQIGKFFLWSLGTFCNGDEWAEMRLIGRGKGGTITIAVSYDDPYELTAIPVVACIRQFAMQPARPGLWRQALYVDPSFFWRNLQNMGVQVSVTMNR